MLVQTVIEIHAIIYYYLYFGVFLYLNAHFVLIKPRGKSMEYKVPSPLLWEGMVTHPLYLGTCLFML